ncbi:MAG: DcaP family trimeric outer membrane transporter, partial [Bacteroidota bacterium]
GPTGSVTLRTPQIRYGHHNKRGTTWAVAFEYSQPDLTLQEFDTTGVSTVQLFPDLTGRIVRQGVFGLVQLSGVFTTISKEGKDNDVSYTFGYGASLSGTLNILGEHAILYQLTYGKAISRFITTFKGTGKDAVYNPETGDFEGLGAFGGFLSYGIDWSQDLSSNISVGYAQLFNKEYQPDVAYRNSVSLSVDGFWNAIEGARLGVEFVFGKRWNENGETGTAGRIWALFYYDF